jgi:hypothetical protein
MSSANTLDSYDKRYMPAIFDILIALMFAPFGGVKKLRTRALDAAKVGRGTKVLELGCGTGSITKLLLQRGAEVTASMARTECWKGLAAARAGRFSSGRNWGCWKLRGHSTSYCSLSYCKSCRVTCGVKC